MFVGRTSELQTLDSATRRDKALVTLMGRRRIGKSALVAEFSRRHYADPESIYLKFEGAWVTKSKTRDSRARGLFQLEKFSEQFRDHFGVAIHPESWTEAFTFLQKFIPTDRKVLLFFDEISWMADGDTDSFRASLKAFWDTINSSPARLVFVIAGSVTAWIRENILEDAGFHGRVTRSIILQELPIDICGRFLGEHLSAREKIAILMTIGGVPRYLEEIDPVRDSVSNIQDTFFSEGHILNTDYEQIFEHTFDRRADTYHRIIQSLSGSRPLSASEIKRAIHYKSGLIDAYIKDLVHAGFLRQATRWRIRGRNPSWSNYYQIGDNYLRFYLNYVQPNKLRIKRGIYRFSSLEALENWDTVSGLQFENLVANSQPQILEALGLTPNTLIKMYGAYSQTPTARRKGCQIDLLVETSRSIYVCEAKFKSKIGLEVTKEMDDKLDALRTGQDLRGLNVFRVLVYCGKLTKDLEESDYFSHTINFEKFLS